MRRLSRGSSKFDDAMKHDQTTPQHPQCGNLVAKCSQPTLPQSAVSTKSVYLKTTSYSEDQRWPMTLTLVVAVNAMEYTSKTFHPSLFRLPPSFGDSSSRLHGASARKSESSEIGKLSPAPWAATQEPLLGGEHHATNGSLDSSILTDSSRRIDQVRVDNVHHLSY